MTSSPTPTCRLAADHPGPPETTFYAYTKEVGRFRASGREPDPPANFRWVYSFGGTQDAELDPDARPRRRRLPRRSRHHRRRDGTPRRPATCWPSSARAWSAVPANRIPGVLASSGWATARSASGRPKSTTNGAPSRSATAPVVPDDTGRGLVRADRPGPAVTAARPCRPDAARDALWMTCILVRPPPPSPAATLTPRPSRSPLGTYLRDPGRRPAQPTRAASAQWGTVVGPGRRPSHRRSSAAGLVAAHAGGGAPLPPQLAADARLVSPAAARRRPDGAAALWSNLVGLLRPAWRRRLTGQPHLAWEYVFDRETIRIRMWVPGVVPPGMVERAIEAAWPGAHTRTAAAAAARPLRAGPRSKPRAANCVWPAARRCRSAPTSPPTRSAPCSARRPGSAPASRPSCRSWPGPVTGRRVKTARRAARHPRAGRSGHPVGRLLDLLTPARTAAAPPHCRRVHAGPADRAGDVRRGPGDRGQAARRPVRDPHPLRRHRHHDPADTRRAGAPSPRTACAAGRTRSPRAFAAFTEHNYYRRTRLRRPLAALWPNGGSTQGDLLSIPELAALAHLPWDEAIPGLQRAGARAVPPPPGIATTGPGVRPIGVTDTGHPRPVGLRVPDARHHLHILGATGSGKSELMARMILADAEAGRGLVVVDPKGDLVTDILMRLPEELGREGGAVRRRQPHPPADPQPPRRRRRRPAPSTTWCRSSPASTPPPGDRAPTTSSAPACSPCARHARHARADRPAQAAARSPPSGNAPSTTSTTTSCAASGPGTTHLSEPARAQVIAPLMNKLRGLLLRPFVRAALAGGPSTVDMDDVLNGGICLVRIAKDALGADTAHLIGSIVVARTWQAATRRARIPQSRAPRRRPLHRRVPQLPQPPYAHGGHARRGPRLPPVDDPGPPVPAAAAPRTRRGHQRQRPHQDLLQRLARRRPPPRPAHRTPAHRARPVEPRRLPRRRPPRRSTAPKPRRSPPSPSSSRPPSPAAPEQIRAAARQQRPAPTPPPRPVPLGQAAHRPIPADPRPADPRPHSLTEDAAMITNPTPQRALRGHRPERPRPRAGRQRRAPRPPRRPASPNATGGWPACCYEHKVLTTHQIADAGLALPPGREPAAAPALHTGGVIDRFQPFVTYGTAPMHYVLDIAGAAILAREDGIEPRRRSNYRHDRAIGLAYSLHLAHTVGFNGFFTALIHRLPPPGRHRPAHRLVVRGPLRPALRRHRHAPTPTAAGTSTPPAPSSSGSSNSTSAPNAPNASARNSPATPSSPPPPGSSPRSWSGCQTPGPRSPRPPRPGSRKRKRTRRPHAGAGGHLQRGLPRRPGQRSRGGPLAALDVRQPSTRRLRLAELNLPGRICRRWVILSNNPAPASGAVASDLLPLSPLPPGPSDRRPQR